jgi:cell fate regulator YaaT (PSP1 superfamily)
MTDRQSQVVGVRFRPAGLIYQFDTGGLLLQREDRVIVETERGSTIGTVAVPPQPRTSHRNLHRVIKKADSRDLMREDQGLQRERSLYRDALGPIRASGLGLKLVKVESLPDAGKTVFYCAADEKVETRDLAAALGTQLGTRIEIRQIGARDEARAQGGVGVCGRELCCSSWLTEFQPVTVKMAKEQGLSLNPSKLAGQCGRLKCCLKYEYQTYQDLRRDLPRIGARVQSVQGDGQITRHNALRQTAMLRRADDGVEVEVTLADLVERRPEA